MAVNDDYLAVGDPKANRVVLYRRNIWGGWSRMQEIMPPKGSFADLAGAGFGYALDLDEDTLIIGAYDWLTLIDWLKMQPDKNFGAVYTANIREDGRVAIQEIPIPQANLEFGYSLSFLGNQVAFAGFTKLSTGPEIQRILVADPTNGKITRVIGPPQRPEEEYIWPQLESPPSVDFDSFGWSMDENNGSLLLGGGYFATPDGNVKRILFNEEGLSLGASSVVLTDNLIAIGRATAMGTGETLLLRRSAEDGWSYVDGVSLGGPLDASGSQVLISLGRVGGMPSIPSLVPDHLLVQVDGDQVVVSSQIRWSRNYESAITANGVIDSEDLILSAEGRVIQLSMANLPSSYWIIGCRYGLALSPDIINLLSTAMEMLKW